MPAKMSETDEKALKERYLRVVGELGTLTGGCKAAKISPNTVYKWREFDDEFVILEHQAREMCADELEATAIERAKDRSDVLLIFMLKAMRPEKYRERVGVEHSGSISTVDTELDSRIAQRLEKMATRSEGAVPVATGS